VYVLCRVKKAFLTTLLFGFGGYARPKRLGSAIILGLRELGLADVEGLSTLGLAVELGPSDLVLAHMPN